MPVACPPALPKGQGIRVSPGALVLTATLGVLALCVLLLGWGCQSAADGDADGDVVARVNGFPIDVQFFRTTYVDHLIQSGANDTRANRYAHLDNLADAILLGQEAARRGLDQDAVFQRRVELETEKAAGAAFFESAFLATLPALTEAEERRAFVLSREKRVVSHLYFRNAEQAQASYRRLAAGRPFLDEAAQVYDLEATDSTAGRLGVIGFYQVDPAFADAAFTTPVDSFSAPVRSRYGYHIVRVDEVVREPLLTESQFQSARSGVAQKYRLHVRMKEGDRFVREFMEGLDVRVDEQAIRRLRSAILDIENSVEPQPVDVVAGAEVVAVRPSDVEAVVGAGVPLATYTMNGEDIIFTAGDYLRWLPELPFQEARNRTAASVGRAIRNDAFAREGMRRGLLTDSVRTEVQKRARLMLSDAFRMQLRRDTTQVPTEEERALLPGRAHQQGSDTAALLAPLLPEFRLLRQLRSEGGVAIDSVRFEALSSGLSRGR